MGFPTQRLRRLRRNQTLRSMVRECDVRRDDLIYPLFVVHGRGIKQEIKGLAGNYHHSVDLLKTHAAVIAQDELVLALAGRNCHGRRRRCQYGNGGGGRRWHVRTLLTRG